MDKPSNTGTEFELCPHCKAEPTVEGGKAFCTTKGCRYSHKVIKESRADWNNFARSSWEWHAQDYPCPECGLPMEPHYEPDAPIGVFCGQCGFGIEGNSIALLDYAYRRFCQ